LVLGRRQNIFTYYVALSIIINLRTRQTLLYSLIEGPLLLPSQNILMCEIFLFWGEILPRHENSTISCRSVQLVGVAQFLFLMIIEIP
jgi:hypothetical protein